MFRTRRALPILVALAWSGCLCGETVIRLDPPRAPIPVTARAWVALTSRRCFEYPFDARGNVKPHTSCSSEGVPVEGASVDDPSLFEARPDRSFVQLRALAPGTTTVRASARGASWETGVEARTTNRVQVSLQCDVGADGPDGGTPAVFAVGAQFQLSATAHSGDAELLGLPEEPVRCDVATVESPGTPLTFVSRATPGRGTITSAHDPALAIPVRVFAPSEFTVDLPPPTTEWGLNTAMFRALVLVDGKRPCVDNVVRRFEITTPGVCAFRSSGTDGGLSFETNRPDGALATRLQPGVCTVQVLFPARSDLLLESSHTF